MAKSFQRHDLFSCELGLENDDHDDNNDKNVDIKIGSLIDFEVLVFFGFSGNDFKEHNGSIDGRFKAYFWLSPTVTVNRLTPIPKSHRRRRRRKRITYERIG